MSPSLPPTRLGSLGSGTNLTFQFRVRVILRGVRPGKYGCCEKNPPKRNEQRLQVGSKGERSRLLTAKLPTDGRRVSLVLGTPGWLAIDTRILLEIPWKAGLHSAAD